MLIVGEKEENEGSVSVRKQGDGDKGTFSLDDFVEIINNEIKMELEK